MTCNQVPKITHFIQLFLFIQIFISILYTRSFIFAEEMKNDTLKPTIIISILARNKAHTLPYFFGYVEKLDYPRDRISLWIRSDHNIDNTNDVLKTWLDANRKFYHSVDFSYEEHPESFSDGTGVFEWSSSHFEHLIHLKETALLAARKLWADYIMFLDCDVFLVNNNTLNLLMKEDKTIIAPVLETLGAYSNYWCGMTEQGYYKRTDDYLPILEREQIGCFDVPMVHSAVLINLRHKNSLQLTFDPKKIDGYSGPVDDIIIFAHSARTADVKMWVTNEEPFGYMLTPLEKENTLQDDREQLQNLKVEMMVEYPQIYISPSLQHFVPKKPEDTAGFDQAYLINLERRPERRERMLNTLSEMGIQAHILKAVDGKALNDSYIEEMGIKMLPEYADPYYKRSLTRGEIGCFLSHYHVWKDASKL
ncbi:UNVERIFIED_CONTAM: Procollagen galactosyltransferase 1 [Trichonephila clavipes]